MLADEDKKYVLNEYLRNIDHISDKEYQKKAWIRGEFLGTDFDETVCQFIDIGDPILENYKDFWVTERQYKILMKFRKHFINFADDHSWPLEFIDTTEWDEITKMAKVVLHAFNYQNN